MNRDDLPSPNAVCEICGREYRKCRRCIELKSHGIKAWKLYCDTLECYIIWSAINQPIDNITEKGFKEKCNIELPDGRTLTPDTKSKINSFIKNLRAKQKLGVPARSASKDSVQSK